MNIVVLGSGQIGAVIATMLAEYGHQVTLADAATERLAEAEICTVAKTRIDAADLAELSCLLADKDIVVSACPYFLNQGIARVAIETGTNYFDLTEDIAVTQVIKQMAAQSEVVLVPQCGLAPGFICLLGASMAARFEKITSINMRVGALPRYPTNVLRYNVTWSIDGLINEYCNPCEMILAGRRVLVPALEGLDHVMIDGVTYEAFNTSGGLGTLAETFAGRVELMSYKTLRYPGHAEIMKLLLHGLGLADDRQTMRRILARAAPFSRNDIVVIFVTGIGERHGRVEEDSIVLRYDGTPSLGAIQFTTAAGCVAMVELFIAGKLPQRGFIRQEDAALADFFATRAGGMLAHGAQHRTGPHSTGAVESGVRLT